MFSAKRTDIISINLVFERSRLLERMELDASLEHALVLGSYLLKDSVRVLLKDSARRCFLKSLIY